VPGNDRQIGRDSLEAETSKRLQAIVAAAEQAATKVIDDAEREARRQLADAQAQAEALAGERLSRLSADLDALVAQANDIRFRAQELLVSLSRLRSELQPGEGEEQESGQWSQGWAGYGPKVASSGAHLSAVDAKPPQTEPEPAAEEELRPAAPPPIPLRDDTREGPAGARLLATQMAVSGSSREEIAARLRNGFQIDDPEPILDAILGPEA
jgi:thioesterase domain-containing protein